MAFRVTASAISARVPVRQFLEKVTGVWNCFHPATKNLPTCWDDPEVAVYAPGGPAARSGPMDEAAFGIRKNVLVYTSEPLSEQMHGVWDHQGVAVLLNIGSLCRSNSELVRVTTTQRAEFVCIGIARPAICSPKVRIRPTTFIAGTSIRANILYLLRLVSGFDWRWRAAPFHFTIETHPLRSHHLWWMRGPGLVSTQMIYHDGTETVVHSPSNRSMEAMLREG